MFINSYDGGDPSLVFVFLRCIFILSILENSTLRSLL